MIYVHAAIVAREKMWYEEMKSKRKEMRRIKNAKRSAHMKTTMTEQTEKITLPLWKSDYPHDLSLDQNTSYPLLVWDAINLIESNFSFLEGIDHLTELLAITKPHLIRTFTACVGISPGQYLTQVRLYHAKYLLATLPEIPLDAIAGACGYSCANYFSKAFRKHVGLSPREYGRQQQSHQSARHKEDQLIRQIYL